MILQVIKFLIGAAVTYGIRFLANKSLDTGNHVSQPVYIILGFISISLLGLSYKGVIETIKERKNK